MPCGRSDADWEPFAYQAENEQVKKNILINPLDRSFILYIIIYIQCAQM